MGAWGPGIFSDDVACDVRDEFRALIGDGVSVEEATDQALDLYLADTEDGWVALIALAVTQWKTGRLLDSVRDRAVAVIDSGLDLVRWVESGQLSRRKQALAKARAQVLSPQPRPVRIAKVERNSTPFTSGDLVLYNHDSGQTVVLWCIKNVLMGRGTNSHFEPLDLAPEIAAREPESARFSRGIEQRFVNVGFLVGGCHRLTPDKYQIVGTVDRPETRRTVTMITALINPTKGLTGTSLDRMLDRYLPLGASD